MRCCSSRLCTAATRAKYLCFGVSAEQPGWWSCSRYKYNFYLSRLLCICGLLVRLLPRDDRRPASLFLVPSLLPHVLQALALTLLLTFKRNLRNTTMLRYTPCVHVGEHESPRVNTVPLPQCTLWKYRYRTWFISNAKQTESCTIKHQDVCKECVDPLVYPLTSSSFVAPLLLECNPVVPTRPSYAYKTRM